MFNNYYDRHIRDVCHGVKQRDKVAVNEMADYLLNLERVSSRSVLVPAPQHEGFAIYTREIADIIAGQMKCRVADVLISSPRKPLYELKKHNVEGLLEFRLREMIHGDEIFFVDNVIDTGMTFRAADRLLGGILKPLVYAEVKI